MRDRGTSVEAVAAGVAVNRNDNIKPSGDLVGLPATPRRELPAVDHAGRKDPRAAVGARAATAC